MVFEDYRIWGRPSYIRCLDLRSYEGEYFYNKNFSLHIAFNCYYMDTSSMEMMEIDKTNKINLWTMLTAICLYFIAKKGSEERRLLGWGIVLRLGLPIFIPFAWLLLLSLL